MTHQLSSRPEPPHVPGYRLGEVAGRGASSVVWFAQEEAGGQPVVVKVSASGAFGAPEELMAMVVRERAVLERVTGEHLLRLRDVVPLGADAVAMVLDAAGGGSLHDLVSARGALHPGEVVTIFTPVAAAVAELHAAGVVHADLAPGNVLFTGDGKPMLGDLGAARLVGEQHPSAVAGTAGFVAPEVSRGGLPTEASDVWSVAALLWYAVTGGSRPPQEGADGEAWGSVGPVFADLLVPMLASDPEQRPAAAELPARIYRAFTPAPVQLAGPPVDAAVAVTRRIRHEAALERPVDLPADGGVTGRGRRLRLRRRDRSVPRGHGRRARRVARWSAAVLLAVSAVVAASALRTPHELSDAAAPPGPVDASTADRAMGALAVADPRALLQALAEARAQALTAADAGLLRAALLEGSPAFGADLRTLEALRSTGRRWSDLAFTVRSAELVSAGRTSAQVRAVVDQGSYVVLGPGAARTEKGAVPGSELTYDLQLTEAGWRITDLSQG